MNITNNATARWIESETPARCYSGFSFGPVESELGRECSDEGLREHSIPKNILQPASTSGAIYPGFCS